MRDNPADQPDSPPGGTAPTGTVSNAAGATGIVAIGQALDDPWRGIVSVAGPWLVVVWRWFVPILKSGLQLWGLTLLDRLAKSLGDDDRKQIQKKIQDTRLAVMEKLRRRIGGGTAG